MADRETSEARSTISMILMKLLHQIGINKKMRKRSRYNWIQYEELSTFMLITKIGKWRQTFVFGSQVEASTTPGLRSDIDVVNILSDVIAIRNIQDAVPGIDNYLMVADEDTYPGYYKLQYLDLSSMEHLRTRPFEGLAEHLAIDHNQRLVFKPTFYHSSVTEIHGPASRTSREMYEFDYIKGVRVDRWSQDAISWLLRPRHNNWITQDVFLTKEAFLVPVGNPLSVERHLEWRISFTTIERELMWILSNTQMACYILMKMINKCFITPAVGESLSSYHCKTALFHLIDNTDSEFWKPNNLLTCLNLMLKTISSWVESGFCPNYFITNENMFLGKIHGRLRRRLHSLLVHLIDQDFMYLTQIGYDGLGQAFSEACSKQQAQPNTSHAILEAFKRNNCNYIQNVRFMYIPVSVICFWYQNLLQSGNTAVMHTLIQGYPSCSTVLQDSLSVLLALLCSHFGTQLASLCIANRMCCRDIEMAHMFLWIGTDSDVTSGRLKLAGFYLKLGYASLAEEVLTAVEQDFRHYVSHVSPVDLKTYKDETYHKLLSEEMTTSQHFSSCIALSVIYLPSEIHCTLPPLCFEMFRSVGADPGLRDPEKHYWYNWAVVDARPYMYFLQHQTYSALGMNTHRLVALQNLKWSIRQEMIRHAETCLNLLAYCFRQEGLADLALEYLLLSLQFKPDHNAAVWQIFDMLNQTCNNQIMF